MRKFVILAVLPLFFSGTTAKIKAPVIPPCPCADSSDTTLPDSLRLAIERIVITKADLKYDSFTAIKMRTLDSLSGIKDSIAIEIQKIKDLRRRSVIMRIEELPSLAPYPHDGLIWWGRVVNGDTLFTHTEPVIIK